MRRPKATTNLAQDLTYARHRQRPLLAEERSEALSGEQLHRQVEGTVFTPAEVEDVDDVVVVDLSGGFSFLYKAPGDLRRGGVVAPEELHRGLLGQDGVLGEVDRAHTAAA